MEEASSQSRLSSPCGLTHVDRSEAMYLLPEMSRLACQLIDGDVKELQKRDKRRAISQYATQARHFICGWAASSP